MRRKFAHEAVALGTRHLLVSLAPFYIEHILEARELSYFALGSRRMGRLFGKCRLRRMT